MKEYGKGQATILHYFKVATIVIAVLFTVISVLVFSLAVSGQLEEPVRVLGGWGIVSMSILLAICLAGTISGKKYERIMFKFVAAREREFLDNMEIIRSLSSNYNGVYYCDLLTGEVRFLQVSNRIERYMGREFSESHPLEWYVEAYSRKLVKKEYQEEFVCTVSTTNLREKLKDRDYYTYIYIGDKNGVDAYFEMKAAKINGSENRVVIGFADVDDEIREKEEQTRLTRDALKQANQSNLIRESMIDNVSENIKHPVDAIVEIAKMLEGNEDNPESVKASGSHILVETEGIYTMLSDICEVNRIQNNKFMLNITETNLDEILARAVESLDILAHDHGVEIEVSKQLVHSRVFCDADRVGNIVRHLISCSIENSQRGGKILAQVFETQVLNKKAYFDFVIEDSGHSFDKAFIESLKGENALEMAYGASAQEIGFLSLSIAKVIVGLMGGKFDITCNEESGTRISVLVPFDIVE